MLLTLPARTNVWEMYSCIHVWSPLMSINIICSSNQITPIPSFLAVSLLRPESQSVYKNLHLYQCRTEEDCEWWRRPTWHWAARVRAGDTSADSTYYNSLFLLTQTEWILNLEKTRTAAESSCNVHQTMSHSKCFTLEVCKAVTGPVRFQRGSFYPPKDA